MLSAQEENWLGRQRGLARPLRAYSPGALGGGGPHAHQRTGRDLGADGALRNWPRPEPLCQRQALFRLAVLVSRNQDQRGKGALGTHTAIYELRTPGTDTGRHEFVAQRLGARRLLSSALRVHGHNTAVAYKPARMVYFMLTCGEDHVDQDQQHYEEQSSSASDQLLCYSAVPLFLDS